MVKFIYTGVVGLTLKKWVILKYRWDKEECETKIKKLELLLLPLWFIFMYLAAKLNVSVSLGENILFCLKYTLLLTLIPVLVFTYWYLTEGREQTKMYFKNYFPKGYFVPIGIVWGTSFVIPRLLNLIF
jgi:hypothetical protein